MRRRSFIAGILALPSVAAMARLPRVSRYDAVVLREGIATKVAPAVFRTIADALDAAPKASTRPYRVLIGPGVWREKLVIDKPFVHLHGSGRDRSVIRFDAAAGEPGPDGVPWGTWGCATLRVAAPDFAASNLTIENGFDYLAHLREPLFEPIGSNGPQAVALMLDAGSDRARIDDVDIVGHQDTLFVDAGRSLLRGCRVSGSVDFVFGAGRCLLDRCEIVSRHRPGKERQGYVAAPSTLRHDACGLVFQACRLHCEAQVPPRSVALGRAWRPTREFADGRYGDPDAIGAAAYIGCWMDAHIDPLAWDAMSYTARDGSRIKLEPAQARFAEYASRGPGAHRSAARPQLTRQQARAYSLAHVFADWNPDP